MAHVELFFAFLQNRSSDFELNYIATDRTTSVASGIPLSKIITEELLIRLPLVTIKTGKCGFVAHKTFEALNDLLRVRHFISIKSNMILCFR